MDIVERLEKASQIIADGEIENIMSLAGEAAAAIKVLRTMVANANAVIERELTDAKDAGLRDVEDACCRMISEIGESADPSPCR